MLGVLGIEDKLQDNVDATLVNLRAAGIKTTYYRPFPNTNPPLDTSWDAFLVWADCRDTSWYLILVYAKFPGYQLARFLAVFARLLAVSFLPAAGEKFWGVFSPPQAKKRGCF